MEIFVLHILKLNIIAAVIILLVKLLAILFKGQVSARWKYIIWLLITVSLCIPVRLPANFTLVDFKVQRSIQQNEQNSKTTDYAARPGERQQKMEIMSSVNNNTKSQSEVPEQKEFIVHTAGKWLETIAVIFALSFVIAVPGFVDHVGFSYPSFAVTVGYLSAVRTVPSFTS